MPECDDNNSQAPLSLGGDLEWWVRFPGGQGQGKKKKKKKKKLILQNFHLLELYTIVLENIHMGKGLYIYGSALNALQEAT